MSFGRGLSVGTMGMFGGLLVNILTNPASDYSARFWIQLVPTLLAALLVVIILRAILRTFPLRASGASTHFHSQLFNHRAELRRLKDSCLSEDSSTAACIAAWRELRRSIVALESLERVGGAR